MTCEVGTFGQPLRKKLSNQKTLHKLHRSIKLKILIVLFAEPVPFVFCH